MPASPKKKAAKPASRNKSNRAWIERHINDPYVQAATRQGYRSRAAFKLLEIDRRERLLKPGGVIIDLGAAPGSWSQVVAERLGERAGRIIALDVLPMAPIPGVQFIQGDFREQEVMQRLAAALEGARADLILSDMAPNLSGIGAADAARSAHLWDLALEFALAHLEPDGRLLVKAFQGSGYSQFVEQLKRHFARVVVRKPAASRQESAETYLVASGLKAAALTPGPDSPRRTRRGLSGPGVRAGTLKSARSARIYARISPELRRFAPESAGAGAAGRA